MPAQPVDNLWIELGTGGSLGPFAVDNRGETVIALWSFAPSERSRKPLTCHNAVHRVWTKKNPVVSDP